MSGQQADLTVQRVQRLDAAFSRVTRYLASRGGGETGLSPSQRIVLRALMDGAMRVSEVAAHLGVTLSAATGLVDRMAKAELVTRERDRGDRRVVWVRLTEEGQQNLAAAERFRQQLLQGMITPLSHDEIDQLCATLERMLLDT